MNEEKRNRIADFFRTERNRMVGYVRRLIDDAADRDGEDVVQDVLLNLFAMPDITLPVENLSAYIYRALHNRIIDLLRKRRGDLSLDDEDSPSLAGLLRDLRYDAASELEKTEIRGELFQALDSLSEEEEALVLMTEFEGRTFREIAEEWEAPMGTLLSKKSRAMKKLRESLSKKAGG